MLFPLFPVMLQEQKLESTTEEREEEFPVCSL